MVCLFLMFSSESKFSLIIICLYYGRCVTFSFTAVKVVIKGAWRPCLMPILKSSISRFYCISSLAIKSAKETHFDPGLYIELQEWNYRITLNGEKVVTTYQEFPKIAPLLTAPIMAFRRC